MEDERVWSFERSLWTEGREHLDNSIDNDCLMIVPKQPHIMSGSDAIEAIAASPRWGEVVFSDEQVARPEEGMIVVAYHARVRRAGSADYAAYCTSTYRRLGHEDWRVVQHQQTAVDLA